MIEKVDSTEITPTMNVEPKKFIDVNEVESLLGDDDFNVRQTSMLNLWRAAETCREAVYQATRSSDREVVRRAEWIVRRWEIGITPQNAEIVGRHLDEYGLPDAKSLLAAGHFDVVAGILKKLGRPQDFNQFSGQLIQPGSARLPPLSVDQSLRGKLAMAESRLILAVRAEIDSQFSLLALRADAMGKLDDFIEMMDYAADSIPLAIARRELISYSKSPERFAKFPATVANWNLDAKQTLATTLAAIDGEHNKALEMIHNARNEDLERAILLKQRNWQAIINRYTSADNAEDNADLRSISDWSMVMFAADRIGDQELFDRAAQWLIETAPSPENLEGGPAVQEAQLAVQRLSVLAIHGEIDSAIALATKREPRSAVQMALAADRVESAFATLGFSVDGIDSQIEQRTTELLTARAKDAAAQLTESDRNLLSIIPVLDAIGRLDLARRMVSRLTHSEAKVGQHDLRDYVLLYLQLDKPAWVREFAVLPEEQSLPFKREQVVRKASGDMSVMVFKSLMNAVERMRFGLTFQRKVHVVCELFDGELPAEFDPDGDLDRLFELLSKPVNQPTAGLRSLRMPFTEIALEVGQMMRSLGKTDLARRAFIIAIENRNSKALLELARMEMSSGNSEISMSYFKRVVRELETAEQSIEQVDEYLMQAIACMYVLTMRAGLESDANGYKHQLEIAACTPDLAARRSAAWVLVSHGYEDLALKLYDEINNLALLRGENNELYQSAIHYSAFFGDRSPGESSARTAISFFRLTQATPLLGQYYVYRPVSMNRKRIEALISDGPPTLERRQEMRRLLKIIASLAPFEVNVAEDTLPKIRKWGDAEAADQAFDSLMNQGIEYANSFPRDATECNNIAWAAAMNDQRLEEALQLSRQAVRLQPDAAIYRDTLAEVLYRLDRVDEAIQVEKACLLDSPDDWHIHEQIKRFETDQP